MSNLNGYLEEKRHALQEWQAQAEATGAEPYILKADVRVEGRSGVRRIRIRDFQIISDSGPELAGYNLGPTSPELQLGVLGSCLTHIFLIQAALQHVPLDALEVEITGQIDPYAGQPGHEDIPIYPHNIAYTVHITSQATEMQINDIRQCGRSTQSRKKVWIRHASGAHEKYSPRKYERTRHWAEFAVVEDAALLKAMGFLAFKN